MRWRTASAVLLTAELVLGPVGGASAAVGAGGAADAGTRTDLPDALAVLHDWDARRETAYLDADATALRHLYVPGSAAGRRDLRTLRWYDVRRWRITSVATQVRTVRVLDHRTDRWTVRVTDRVRGVATTPRACVLLAAGRFRTHDVTFRATDGRWRVADVVLRPGRSRAPH